MVQDAEQREMRIRMRKAQSEMKGVKLQYTDEGRVMFQDVAGIGEAQVFPPPLPCVPPTTRPILFQLPSALCVVRLGILNLWLQSVV